MRSAFLPEDAASGQESAFALLTAKMASNRASKQESAEAVANK